MIYKRKKFCNNSKKYYNKTHSLRMKEKVNKHVYAMSSGTIELL